MPIQPLPPVTFTVIGKLPVCVGVPFNTPVDDNVNPAGNEPVFNVKVAPPTAPVCVKVWLKATPAVPVVVTGLVTVMVWQLITNVYVEPVPIQPCPLVTFMVIGKLPVCVGVPLNTPADDNIKPVGNVPVLMVNVAPPVAPVCVKV